MNSLDDLVHGSGVPRPIVFTEKPKGDTKAKSKTNFWTRHPLNSFKCATTEVKYLKCDNRRPVILTK